MEDEVRRMDLLIADMLELAKYESGTYKMDFGSFYINIVIERVCTKLTQDIQAKRLLLKTSLRSVEVEGNKHRIEQVIVNFLTNAIRYTPDQESILVTTMEERDTVQVCIENKGSRFIDLCHKEQVEFVDLSSIFADNQNLYSSDGVHFKPEFYRTFARMVASTAYLVNATYNPFLYFRF